MKTLIVRLYDILAKELEAEAKKDYLTKSEVARSRLIAVGLQGHSTNSSFDLIADLVDSVKNGPADVSAKKKQYLKTTEYGKSLPR